MKLHYYSSPNATETQIYPLLRRGFHYGWIGIGATPAPPDAAEISRAWRNNEAILLPGILAESLPKFATHIAEAHQLMEQTLAGEDISELFEAKTYRRRLQPDFELTTVSYEEHDAQGIEKVFFDAWQGEDLIADDLWCKASWLSFDEDDASLRFRFSFGMEGYEDVAANPLRQQWAARLTDAVFPESAAVTGHEGLIALLTRMLDCPHLEFTERIVYFNAPNGGALMHHDVERGHDGVLFAQMSGATFWLALAKPRLMDEMAAFLAAATPDAWPELRALGRDRSILSAHLDNPEHEIAEALLDRSPEFFRHLIERGFAYVLRPGDILLMPQYDLETCVWHSVICLGDEPGEGLSFALKKSQKL